MNNIGTLMQASAILQQGVDNPVAVLRKELDDMRSELRYYESKHPDINTTKRWQRIQKLDAATREIEKSEPLELMKIIRTKLDEAYHDEFHPSVVVPIIPLFRGIMDLSTCRPAYVNLTEAVVHNPYEYEHLGWRQNTAFICSDLRTKGGEI